MIRTILKKWNDGHTLSKADIEWLITRARYNSLAEFLVAPPDEAEYLERDKCCVTLEAHLRLQAENAELENRIKKLEVENAELRAENTCLNAQLVTFIPKGCFHHLIDNVLERGECLEMALEALREMEELNEDGRWTKARQEFAIFVAHRGRWIDKLNQALGRLCEVKDAGFENSKEWHERWLILKRENAELLKDHVKSITRYEVEVEELRAQIEERGEIMSALERLQCYMDDYQEDVFTLTDCEKTVAKIKQLEAENAELEADNIALKDEVKRLQTLEAENAELQKVVLAAQELTPSQGPPFLCRDCADTPEWAFLLVALYAYDKWSERNKEEVE